MDEVSKSCDFGIDKPRARLALESMGAAGEVGMGLVSLCSSTSEACPGRGSGGLGFVGVDMDTAGQILQ